MNQLSISVVVPAYNEEHTLVRCLRSIVPQLAPNDELIVIDNNSTDATAKIAKQLGAKVIPEKLQGISYARNTGFKAAENPIVARTDADTIVGDGWLKPIRDYYSGHPDLLESVAIGGPVYLREFLPLKLGVHQGLTKKTLGHETLIGGNMAMGKVLWEKVQPKLSNDDELYAEDMEMALIVTKLGGSVDFVPSMITFTSARWMIRHPIRSLRNWNKKIKRTKQLTG